MEEEHVEHTLCSLNEIFVFKLPPRTNAAGYKAADWGDPMWKGRLRIIAKGDDAAIQLLDTKAGSTFAICPVRRGGPKAIEPVLDSSRYFVLRIENNAGQHAFIGIGFQQRGDAFDFSVALNDHERQVEREKDAGAELASSPAQDFSLKEGETIRISMKTKKKGRPGAGSGAGSATATDGGFMGGAGGLLAPPPPPAGASRQRRRGGADPPTSAAAAPAASAGGLGDDLLGLGFDPPASSASAPASAAPAPGPAPALAAAASAWDDPFASSSRCAGPPTRTPPPQLTATRPCPSSSSDAWVGFS